VPAGRRPRDAAFERLREAVARQDPQVWAVNTEFFLLPLHADPRWKELLRQIGLPRQ